MTSQPSIGDSRLYRPLTHSTHTFHLSNVFFCQARLRNKGKPCNECCGAQIAGIDIIDYKGSGPGFISGCALHAIYSCGSGGGSMSMTGNFIEPIAIGVLWGAIAIGVNCTLEIYQNLI